MWFDQSVFFYCCIIIVIAYIVVYMHLHVQRFLLLRKSVFSFRSKYIL